MHDYMRCRRRLAQWPGGRQAAGIALRRQRRANATSRRGTVGASSGREINTLGRQQNKESADE